MIEQNSEIPEWLRKALAEPTTTIPLAGRARGLSRNTAYEAARRGDIQTIDFGRLKRVPTSWLRRILQLDKVVA